MVGLGGIEEKERVPGGGRIDDDEAVLRFVHDPRERAEDRHFFGARRPQVFFEQGPARVVEGCSRCAHRVLDVRPRLGLRVDATDPKVGRR